MLTRLVSVHPEPGINGLTALAIDVIQNKKLLTGDRHLGKAAGEEGIQTLGTLGVLDRMIEHRIINPNKAARVLEAMLQNNARLPKAECHRRLSRWG